MLPPMRVSVVGVLEGVGDGRWEDVCGETRCVKVEGGEVVGVGTKILGVGGVGRN